MYKFRVGYRVTDKVTKETQSVDIEVVAQSACKARTAAKKRLAAALWRENLDGLSVRSYKVERIGASQPSMF